MMASMLTRHAAVSTLVRGLSIGGGGSVNVYDGEIAFMLEQQDVTVVLDVDDVTASIDDGPEIDVLLSVEEIEVEIEEDDT